MIETNNLLKPSGIEWLYTIPINWNITKLKYVGNLYGGLTGKSGGDFNNEENPNNKPFIPYTNIFNNTYISKDHFHYVLIEENENQNRVKKYDLFFLMSSETHKDLGKSCILLDDVDELYLNSFCKGFRINKDFINPIFLNYQILGHLHRELISVEGKGFTRINLRQDKINDLIIFYPSIKEQEQIVKFLDEKTSIIDKLISNKERKIELLKEQRSSLINEVITKGLDPNVKMKDSGVEWIGEIPEHWKFVRLGVLGCFSKGKGITKDKIKENGFPCIRNGEIYTSYNLRFSEPKSFIDEMTINESIKVKKGTLFFTGDGETIEEIGKCVVYLGDEEIYVGGGINIFTPNTEKVSPIYLSYVMSSKSCVYQKSVGGKGEIVVHIYSKQLRDVQFGLPKLTEQQQIVEYLDKHTQEIDDLVQLEQKKIKLLIEYRQSLISEVVTGKLKVNENTEN